MEKISDHCMFSVRGETHALIATTERRWIFFLRRSVYYGTPKHKSTWSWQWVRLERDGTVPISRWTQNSLSYCLQHLPHVGRGTPKVSLASILIRLGVIPND